MKFFSPKPQVAYAVWAPGAGSVGVFGSRAAAYAAGAEFAKGQLAGPAAAGRVFGFSVKPVVL